MYGTVIPVCRLAKHTHCPEGSTMLCAPTRNDVPLPDTDIAPKDMRAGTCVVESDLDIVPAGEKRHLTSKLVLEPTKAVAVDTNATESFAAEESTMLVMEWSIDPSTMTNAADAAGSFTAEELIEPVIDPSITELIKTDTTDTEPILINEEVASGKTEPTAERPADVRAPKLRGVPSGADSSEMPSDALATDPAESHVAPTLVNNEAVAASEMAAVKAATEKADAAEAEVMPCEIKPVVTPTDAIKCHRRCAARCAATAGGGAAQYLVSPCTLAPPLAGTGVHATRSAHTWLTRRKP